MTRRRIRTVQGALNAIAKTQSAEDLAALSARLEALALNDGGAIRAAIELRRSATLRARPVTDRQTAFLAAIGDLAEDGANAPTTTQVGRQLGITRRGADTQLELLEKKGLVRSVPITIRGGWVLTEEGERVRAQGD